MFDENNGQKFKEVEENDVWREWQGTDIPFEGKDAEFQTHTYVEHWLALALIVYSFVGNC